MTMVAGVDAIEIRRRLSGLSYTKLASLTGIKYPRLWRFFQKDGPLTRFELARMDTVLNGTAGESEATPTIGGAQ